VKLTILGSGTVDPRPDRACSGYFLETSAGDCVVDIGNGVVRRAMEHGVALPRVERLFLSHLHPDHTSDIVTFLFARKHAPPPWSRQSSLTLFGPPGTQAFMQAVFQAWPSLQDSGDGPAVEIVEFSMEEHVLWSEGQVSVTVVPVVHGDMEAVGYRFVDADRVFAYSGDSKLCDGVKRVASGADLFLCECSCFSRGCEPLYCRSVHLSWEDVAEICEEANPSRVVLTHLYQLVLDDKPNPLESLQGVLSAPVSLAVDGAQYQI